MTMSKYIIIGSHKICHEQPSTLFWEYGQCVTYTGVADCGATEDGSHFSKSLGILEEDNIAFIFNKLQKRSISIQKELGKCHTLHSLYTRYTSLHPPGAPSKGIPSPANFFFKAALASHLCRARVMNEFM